MTKWPLLEQAIRFQKTATDNAFSLCSAMQHNGKEVLENTLNLYPWLFENGKQGYLVWARGCIQATDNLKILIDRGFQEIETHLSDPTPAEQDEDAKKAAPSRTKQATVQRARKATASAAKKKAAPRRKSAAQAGITKEEPVQKEPVARETTAASNTESASVGETKKTSVPQRSTSAIGTVKKTISEEETAASEQQISALTTKPTEEKQIFAEKEMTAEKQTLAENKESAAALSNERP